MLRMLRQDNIVELKEAFRRKNKSVRVGGCQWGWRVVVACSRCGGSRSSPIGLSLDWHCCCLPPFPTPVPGVRVRAKDAAGGAGVTQGRPGARRGGSSGDTHTAHSSTQHSIHPTHCPSPSQLKPVMLRPCCPTCFPPPSPPPALSHARVAAVPLAGAVVHLPAGAGGQLDPRPQRGAPGHQARKPAHPHTPCGSVSGLAGACCTRRGVPLCNQQSTAWSKGSCKLTALMLLLPSPVLPCRQHHRRPAQALRLWLCAPAAGQHGRGKHYGVRQHPLVSRARAAAGQRTLRQGSGPLGHWVSSLRCGVFGGTVQVGSPVCCTRACQRGLVSVTQDAESQPCHCLCSPRSTLNPDPPGASWRS
jgi:hypothetical protein